MNSLTSDWMPLPGGELEAPRPGALCAACRAGSAKPLCLSCFRAGRDRDRKLAAARDLNTASEARFQESLPFEPVDQARLARLRAARAESRVEARRGVGIHVDKRRQAQIAARHALQRLGEELRARGITVPAARPRVAAGAGA
jgi:hypothetical protein